MLAKLLQMLCLLALAAAIDRKALKVLKSKGIVPSNYVTLASKDNGVKLLAGPRYYIPAGYCGGQINTSSLCGDEKVDGVEVRVSDPLGFARVQLSAGAVHVRRAAAACPADALVDLRLSCRHYKFAHSRSRVRLPELEPESDEDDDDDAESNKNVDDHDVVYNDHVDDDDYVIEDRDGGDTTPVPVTLPPQ